MILQKSKAEDAEELTGISTEAFDTDVSVGGSEKGGPPGYDSKEWHRKMIEEDHLYTCFGDDGTIIGGAVLFENEELFVGRIFINPKYFGHGLGMELMAEIERKFNAQIIRLDTPLWNVRTNRFYKKCGYTETGRDGESVYYEKAKEKII